MFQQPRSLEAALGLLAEPGARLLAGGTDVFPALVDRPMPGPLVDLTRVEGLRGIGTDGSTIRIGAGTTWTDIVSAPLPRGFEALKAAAREIGSAQIQNRATIGGNICNASPAADGVPPLLILDAAVELASATGRRTLPLARFIEGNRVTALRPGEVLTAIVVPAARAGARSTFLKLGSRRYLVISIAMVAVGLEIAAGRIARAAIAVGACSAVAQRLPALEAMLADQPVHASLIDLVAPEHLVALAPIDDIRATAVYRRDAAVTLLRRALSATVSGDE